VIAAFTGTEKFAFNRLVSMMDAISNQNSDWGSVFIQTGSCTKVPKYCEWKSLIPFEAVCEQMNQADVVICHAGAGTTMLAIRLGKIPILVPRKKALGEHVDDHQLLFSGKMEHLKKAYVANDENELKILLKKGKNAFKTELKKEPKKSTLIVKLNAWMEHRGGS